MEQNKSFEKIISDFSETEKKKMKKVSEFAKKHLSQFKRRSGEDYAQHGQEVARTFLEMVKDSSLVAVALLHDLPVNPEHTTLLKQSPLTEKEQVLVKRMHELRRLHISTKEKDLDTFINTISSETSLIPLRMAHRLNDVRHLDRFDEKLQEKIAHESLHMYASIAGRLGMHRWRYEMEDICFLKLQVEPSSLLLKQFEDSREIDKVSLHQTGDFIKKQCQIAKIPVKVKSRFKALYSTYRKMLLKNRNFDELTDRLALRVIVKNIEDCYKTLGIVHTHMHPIAGKLKDYIGAPKENGYQSIHTVVYPLPGVTEQPIEIQIRTEEMHQLCEYGTAAHGKYKDFNYSLKSNTAQIDLIKNFQILRAKTSNAEQFKKALRNYFDEKHMAIFDEKNNLYHIKQPSSIYDFLAILYPGRVSDISEVKRNGRLENIEAQLKNGDVIEATWRPQRSIRKNLKEKAKIEALPITY